MNKHIINKKFGFISLLIVALGFLYSCGEPKLPYQDLSLSFEERAADLVSRMTLEEKISQMTHDAAAIEHLNIPDYDWWNECLHGVGRAGLATVYPQAIGMAAMWDDAHLFQVATAISDEARAKYYDFQSKGKRARYQGLTYWTPNINIFRDPRWGRGMETYGEDPYLAGELGVQFIKGLQGDDKKYLKLVATPKHFAVHSGPESSRHKFNAIASDYDMVETYLPHFKKAIQKGDAYSVMCAYNRLHGEACCGSEYVNNLLRNEWGFKGYIVSDCWAVRDFFNPGDHEVADNVEEASAMAVKAGTDLNCGDSYPALLKAVHDGYITEEEIDVSVTRLMLARMKLGMFDPDNRVPFSKISYSVVDSEENQQLALETTRKSMVLLKNENQILPFSKDVKKVAVIGPNANNVDVLLGNYNGYPSNPKTPFVGIAEKLPNADVQYALGSSWAAEFPYLEIIETEYLFSDSTLTTNGLTVEYYNNAVFKEEPLYVGIDDFIDHAWWNESPQEGVDGDVFSTRWTGYLVPPTTGDYYLGGDGFTDYNVYIDDSLLVSRTHVHHPGAKYEKLFLEADKPYKIKFEYRQVNSTYPMARLHWEKPNQKLQDEAVELAKDADLVVLCVGLSPSLEGEEMKVEVPGFMGGDRTEIALPKVQTELAKAIMKLNKPTVLVLLNGSAVAFNWEAENVPAILEAWYPGQAGGEAIADIIFGDYNPAGRLPVTFYKSVDQLPHFEDYSMKNRTYKYFNGEPLYEFGYGLSYTNFEYGNINVEDSYEAGSTIKLSVDVTNVGDYDGDEVVQLYVSQDNEYAPIRSLQGFKRVTIKKSETKTVEFQLEPENIALFNPDGWKKVYEGNMQISVGGRQPNNKAIDNKQVVIADIEIVGEYLCE